MTDEEQVVQHLRRWRADPVAFAVEVLKAEPDPPQVALLRAFGDPSKQRIAQKACKGVGKTAGLALCAWHFLATRPYPKVVATSITGENLADGLWSEMAKWQARSPWLSAAFAWQKTSIVNRENPENWYMVARSWPKAGDKQAQADSLAGKHADYMCFIMDEAGGIPSAVAATAEAALASGIECRMLIAGNPTHLDGPLYDACSTFRHLWEVIEITGDPDNPGRSARQSITWARQQIEMYGRDNPWVKVNVFGEFPPSSINALLGPDEVNAAMRLHLPKEDYEWSQKRLGVDVARFGDDRTVIFPRQGLAAFPPVIMRGARTTDIAARIMLAKQRWGSELEIIDDTGHWGHGVIDNLITAGINAIGVQFHGPANDKRYKNRRAEGWLEMAKWVQRGGALPQVPEMVAELTTPTYTFSQGVFVLEDKDQIKQRLGRSPDLADALALTFMLPDQPTEQGEYGPIMAAQRQIGGAEHAKSEWDPLRDA